MAHRFLRVFATCTFYFAGSAAFAYQDPLRAPDDQWKSNVPVAHLSQARVVLADWDLIRKDFPLLKDASKSDIETWLLAHGAFMALTQIQAGSEIGVNTEIPIDLAPEQMAYRPCDYGRGLVFEVKDEASGTLLGLLDSKGVGAECPRGWSHCNGLADLGEMIQEFALEKLVHSVLVQSGSVHDTVESYAVLDLGFQVKDSGGQWWPAASVLRQAHFKHGFIDYSDGVEVDKILSKFGITSSAENFIQKMKEGFQWWNGFNLQGFERAPGKFVIVDFGTYAIFQEFPKLGNWIGHRPDPGQQISVANWGMVQDPADPKCWSCQMNPWSIAVAKQLFAARGDLLEYQRIVHRLQKKVSAILEEEKAKWAALNAAALTGVGVPGEVSYGAAEPGIKRLKSQDSDDLP